MKSPARSRTDAPASQAASNRRTSCSSAHGTSRASSRNIPPASTAPSCSVSPTSTSRAPAARAASWTIARSVVAELAGLIQHQHVVLVQRHGPAQLVGAFDLAEELRRCCRTRPGPRWPGPGPRSWPWPARSPAGR